MKLPKFPFSRIRQTIWAIPIMLALAVAQSPAYATQKPITLTVGGLSVRAEVAATQESRERGLMHRRKLGKNSGMLFIFKQPGYHGMWMKNTFIPLSVAFIDKKGMILNIAEMEPHSEVTHSAAGPALYALEMNAGWFRKNNIAMGAAIKGLGKAPASQ